MKVDKSLWQKCQLADICTNATSNITISKIEVGNGDYPLFGANGIVGNINFYHQDKEYIGIVKDGSGVGRVNKYPSNSSLVGTLQYIFPKENISIDFLKYLLISLNLAKYVKGAAIPHIYFRHYKLEKILLPLESEQKTIASELDALQKVINGYKAQIIDLDALAQSIFLDTFGDSITNPKGWKVMKLTEVCSKITDGTHLSPKWVDRGIPFIFVANVKDYSISFNVQKYIDETTYRDLWKSTPIEKGDILYTSVGSYGNPAIVRDDRKFMFQRHIALIKPLHSIINNQYLMYFLTSPSGKKQADDKVIGSAQKTLNLKVIKNFDVLLPPIELQQQFASQVETIEQQKELLRQQLADAEMLMAERMQYYFS